MMRLQGSLYEEEIWGAKQAENTKQQRENEQDNKIQKEWWILERKNHISANKHI